MDNNEEIKVTNIQLFALVLVLFSDILAIITTYNQKLDLENKEPMLSPKDLYKITLFNRILIVVLAFVFLYVNYKLYEISNDEGENLKPYTLQIWASILVIASGLIALYVVKLSDSTNIVDIENPII